MVSTHLAVRTTAQRHICKDCGKMRWGPQSPWSRAACPAAPGRASHTVAVGEEGEGEAAAAGRSAEDSGTGTMTPSGYSPSGQTEGSEDIVKGAKKKKKWRREINGVIGFSKIHQRLNSHCSGKRTPHTNTLVKQNETQNDAGAILTTANCSKSNMAGRTFPVEHCLVMTLTSRFSSFQQMDWNQPQHLMCILCYYIENALETHTC